VYWNPNAQFVKFNTIDDIAKALQAGIFTQQQQQPNTHYLLKPVSGDLRVCLNFINLRLLISTKGYSQQE
jgi:hypothetical protein